MGEQEFVNGGAHAKQAVKYNAQQEHPRSSPCKRRAGEVGNDVSANQSHRDIHYRQSAEANGMHALSRHAQRISVFAQ